MFLIIYSCTSVLFFTITVNFHYLKFPKKGNLRFITEVKNLAINNNMLAFYILTTMFSLAGIPPLAGFFSKLFILLASIKTNLFGLTIFVILFNCVAAFYYLRFSKIMYFEFQKIQLVLIPMSKSNAVFSSICILFLFLLVLDLDFLLAISKLMTITLIK